MTVRYLLSILWMTSCLRVVRGIGSNNVGTMLKDVVRISSIFPGGTTLFDFIVVYNGSEWYSGVNCDVCDSLVIILISKNYLL